MIINSKVFTIPIAVSKQQELLQQINYGYSYLRDVYTFDMDVSFEIMYKVRFGNINIELAW